MLLANMTFDDIEKVLAENPLRRDFSTFDIQLSADAPNPPGWPTYGDLWSAMNEKQDAWIAQAVAARQ